MLESIAFGKVVDTEALGVLLRAYRRHQGLTLKKLAGIANVSIRFLSEIERGKATAEIGKVFILMQHLGLEFFVQPRGLARKIPPMPTLS